jgi:hypothetical protein
MTTPLPTERFRRQHQELLVLAEQITKLLDPAKLSEDASEVRRLVAKFRGLLVVHARMENEALYPRLLAHPDSAVRDKVAAIFADVGPIYDGVDGYSSRWPSADAIQADAAAFIRDTKGIMRTLGARVVRENAELYPLADSLG